MKIKYDIQTGLVKITIKNKSEWVKTKNLNFFIRKAMLNPGTEFEVIEV
jgi:hypothetical protein